MKHFLAVILSLIVGVSVSYPKNLVVVYIGSSQTQPFWIILGNSAVAEAKKTGIGFINMTPSEPSPEAQKNAIDSAVLKKVDGIIVGAADSRGLEDSFNKAEKANIPIVTVDTRVDHSWVVSHIATDNEAGAKMAGEFIVKKTGGKGKVLIIGGTAGHQTAEARKKGVEDICKAAGMKVIVRPCDWDEVKANPTAANEIDANPDLSAIFAAWDPGAAAAAQAVMAAGKKDKIVIVGFDGIEIALKSIKAGEMDATIKQDTGAYGKGRSRVNGEIFTWR